MLFIFIFLVENETYMDDTIFLYKLNWAFQNEIVVNFCKTFGSHYVFKIVSMLLALKETSPSC